MSLDLLLFAVLPYAALTLAAVGTVERYRRHPYTCTSGSTQFLENRTHFWALVPFHYGVLAVLGLHLLAIAAPAAVLAWNAAAVRLYSLEIAGVTGGILAGAGFMGIVLRRLMLRTVRATTAPFDWIVYMLLLAQFTGGVALAVSHTWGSSWFAASVTPYLWSLVRLQPDLSSVSALPWLAKLHVAGAWLLLGAFPFSRLVHIAVVPHQYLWRPPLVVRWYARRSAAGR